MPNSQSYAWRFSVWMAVLLCVAGIGVLFLLLNPVFGFERTAFFASFLLPPLIVALRIASRPIGRRWRELAYLAIFFCFMCGCVAAMVQTIFAGGFQEHRRWAELQNQIRAEPVFELVSIDFIKGGYTAHGKLATPAARDRLIQLANECQVNESKLYGMFSQSLMKLKIEPPIQPEKP